MVVHLSLNVTAVRFRKFIFLFLVAVCLGCQEQREPAAPADLPPTPLTEESPTATESFQQERAAGFTELLNQVESLRAVERQAVIDQYLAHLPDAPITSDETALFIFRGDASTVQLVGDMNNWILESAPHLERLVGTDLWYLESSFEEDARLDYQFVINGDDWRLDPLNPRTMMSGFGPNSELVMPGYQIPPELLPAAEKITPGIIESHTLDSAYLGQTRTFFVYKPTSQIVGAKLPSIYINDGGDYLNLIDTAAILDRLITARVIPPLVAVFVPPISRDVEYIENDDYVRFLSDELVPFIQRVYETDPDPAKTGTMGASLGGLAALYTTLSRPDVFGLTAGQSGAYSMNNDAVIEKLKSANRAHRSGRQLQQDLRMFFVVGAYETSVSGNAATGNLLMANRRLLHALESSEYAYSYGERPEGHSWGLWRGTLGEALSYLYNPDE
jgi:enterochelin esterase family protein